MPVYEYLCQDCRKEFEESQRITDKPLKKCMFCGGSVERLISQSSFALKGGGWYKDGYSASKIDKAPAPATPQSKTNEKKAATKADPGKTAPTPSSTRSS